ncbi:Probable aspartokinase (Aspartate kinase) [Desulforapulum autotrophicum HRM2]|uniref:Aspartokinase n=1 Tax=Desulforapulum autotrophicum (strain ATCC 43914 / DSM 3382 / VKM B-1955 / HRM2) TaxID=177437 RepID=C0QG57_DESAH|nr:aspartate kinase [Desulforapulum autotrophicum]ACN17636.1 Probable aspartokinase (Aspartate kinase) [Desulforapulum autotrophicum HRM2]
MKVIKIGGGCLRGQGVVARIVELIGERGRGNVFVLSALSGITDQLSIGIKMALVDEETIPALIDGIRQEHLVLAQTLIPEEQDFLRLAQKLEKHFIKLERYFFGINFTREATSRMRDIIISYGERLSVILMAGVLQARGEQAVYIMPREAGIITDGRFGDATANMELTTEQMEKNVRPLMAVDTIVFIPGFFGVSQTNEVTTFGRGGSDYSAGVVAAALKAGILEIWKDTEGFMSADPGVVPGAKLISVLSYEEASELAYFGASILHPRTVEPVRKSGINITIKNTLNPDGPGSLITEQAVSAENVVKSVSHSRDIAILKVYASGVGLRQGILAAIATCLSDAGINIKSVVTSQTCICLLLSRKDIEQAHRVLSDIRPRLFRELEAINDNALVCVAGDGLHNHQGIAARCFTAVSEANVNIEMISFGPSKAALYFLVHEDDLEKTLQALHSHFV